MNSSSESKTGSSKISDQQSKRAINAYLDKDLCLGMLNIPRIETGKYDTIRERLETVFRLPHRQFWCHVVHDASILESLRSFLCQFQGIDSALLSDKERELFVMFYRLILRLGTHKEIDIPEFSPTNYASIVYNNGIFDVHTLQLITAVYGDQNAEVMTKMINGLLKWQPLLVADIKKSADSFIKFISNEVNRVCSQSDGKHTNPLQRRNGVHENGFIDVIHQLVSAVRMWSEFIACFDDNAVNVLFDVEFHRFLESLIDKVAPATHARIDKFDTVDPDSLRRSLVELVWVCIRAWRSMAVNKFLNKLPMNGRSSEENYEVISGFLEMLTGAQDNPVFADALQVVHPLKDDELALIIAVRTDTDEFYMQHVLDALGNIREDIKSRQTVFSMPATLRHVDEQQQPDEYAQLVDLFPGLNDGDVRAYTARFECNARDMLEAILEGSITVDFVKEMNKDVDNNRQQETNRMCDLISENNENERLYEQQTAGVSYNKKRNDAFEYTVDKELHDAVIRCTMGISYDYNKDSVMMDSELYNDEFDDAYGQSHDGIIDGELSDDDQVEQQEEKKPIINVQVAGKKRTGIAQSDRPNQMSRAYRINENQTDLPPSDQMLMEPSQVGHHSQYHKSQMLKKKFDRRGGHHHNTPQRQRDSYPIRSNNNRR